MYFRNLVIGAGFVFSLCPVGRCDVSDQIKTTLTEHVVTVTQFKSRETRLAALDSVILIGNVGGKSVLDLQAGFSGTTVLV